MTARKISFKGFTLIELLIVIAILGVLAVVVLVAINPVQQLARTRDSGRFSSVSQIGHALSAYAVNNDGEYPDETGGTDPWDTALVSAGEINSLPSEVTNTLTTLCTGEVQGWCYDASAASGGTDAIVFSTLEADTNLSKCAAATPNAYAVYDTVTGRGGIVCSATVPVFNAAGQTFAN